MAARAQYDQFEAIFRRFNPPDQIDLTKSNFVRKDTLVMAARFVLAFNCRDGHSPTEAADTLTMPEEQLAKEIHYMSTYLFDRKVIPVSYAIWTASSRHIEARTKAWDRYLKKPALTRQELASLAGAAGSEWLASLDRASDDPLCASRGKLQHCPVSLMSLQLPFVAKERLEVLAKHTEIELSTYHDEYRDWRPPFGATNQDKKEIIWAILKREKKEMRRLEKGYPAMIRSWVDLPDEPKSIVTYTRISRYEEIYNDRARLMASRLHMGVCVDYDSPCRYDPHYARNWAYFETTLRGQSYLSVMKASARLMPSPVTTDVNPQSNLGQEAPKPAATDASSTSSSDDATILNLARSNRRWYVDCVLRIQEMKQQDIDKASRSNTELVRQAISSIKLLHEVEGENGYGWDNPASAMVLRSIVMSEDDWLFRGTLHTIGGH